MPRIIAEDPIYKDHYNYNTSHYFIYDIPIGRQEYHSMSCSELCKHHIATATIYDGKIVENWSRGKPLVVRGMAIQYPTFATIGEWLDAYPNAVSLFKNVIFAKNEKIEIVHAHPNAVQIWTPKKKVSK